MKIHNTWFAQATYIGIIGAFVFATTRFTLPKLNIFENFMISIQITTQFIHFQVYASTFIFIHLILSIQRLQSLFYTFLDRLKELRDIYQSSLILISQLNQNKPKKVHLKMNQTSFIFLQQFQFKQLSSNLMFTWTIFSRKIINTIT
ncbi:unnamed protein product [Paramecium pentaurelia]|uniref:Transmembrane protein n=1 Tax=Paramecium pentaurelia TaxID=43138 RepID=A0A8S1TZH8_9CILI|nr:unnamed protein product [Paramecium pentaurelia]